MGHVPSKSRSVGQFEGKSFLRSRGHIFSQIMIKLAQNAYLDNILKMRKVMLKTRSLIIKLYKTTILANKSADVKFKHLIMISGFCKIIYRL